MVIFLDELLQWRVVFTLFYLFPVDTLEKCMLFGLIDGQSSLRVLLQQVDKQLSQLLGYHTDILVQNILNAYLFNVILNC